MKHTVSFLAFIILAAGLLLPVPAEAKPGNACGRGKAGAHNKHCVATATPIPTLTPTPTRRCPQYTPTPAPGGGGGGGYPCP